MRIGLVAVATVMLGLVFMPSALGKPKLPNGTSIDTVNLDTNTILLRLKRPEEGVKVTLKYKMDPAAIISVNGTPATLAHVKKGMRVIGYTEGDEGVLVSLDVQN